VIRSSKPCRTRQEKERKREKEEREGRGTPSEEGRFAQEAFSLISTSIPHKPTLYPFFKGNYLSIAPTFEESTSKYFRNNLCLLNNLCPHFSIGK